VDEIRRCVSIGILKPDEPLPAVRKLASELKVNANTVQQAYRTLEHEGDAYVKRGLGTFITVRAKEAGRGRSAAIARQIAGKMLREGFRHGLLASDLIAALQKSPLEKTRPHSYFTNLTPAIVIEFWTPAAHS
jgi:GntR family transcriptional regulator